MTPIQHAARLSAMGFDTPYILSKFMPSDPDAFMKMVTDNRQCTCHPDEAPVPCQRRYAASECKAAAVANASPPFSETLREYTAMRYMGNCKCGNCQLVPRAALDKAIFLIRALEAWTRYQDKNLLPIAWLIPGDEADVNGFIDAKAFQDGEFTRPVYAAVPIPKIEPDPDAFMQKVEEEVRVIITSTEGEKR